MKPSSSEVLAANVAYYDAHAQEFAARTLNLDMGHLYAPFLASLPPGGSILDAGCGSGRDALHFSRLGYRVSAFDASPEMVRRARALTGLPVEVQTFQDLNAKEEFDGIWACASLLHVPPKDLPGVLSRLAGALKPGGTLFASVKTGQGVEKRGGRYFTLHARETLLPLIEAAGLQVTRVWTTLSVQPKPEPEEWLNVLGRAAPRLF